MEFSVILMLEVVDGLVRFLAWIVECWWCGYPAVGLQ